MWRSPDADALFGDVFQADFLLDTHVRAGAGPLGKGQMSAKDAAKLAALTGSTSGNVDIYSAAFSGAEGFALTRASGASGTAMLVSDSCAVATALAQGRESRSVGGRLLFVPVIVDPQPKQWERLGKMVDFGRMALEPHASWSDGAIAELRCCFMVDARDVKTHLGARLTALTADGADHVAARWSAFATRRGPDAYEQSTTKLAHVLAGRIELEDSDAHFTAGDAVALTLDAAWTLEGAALENVVDRYAALNEAGALPASTDDVIDAVVGKLRNLSALAASAADAIQAHR